MCAEEKVVDKIRTCVKLYDAGYVEFDYLLTVLTEIVSSAEARSEESSK